MDPTGRSLARRLLPAGSARRRLAERLMMGACDRAVRLRLRWRELFGDWSPVDRTEAEARRRARRDWRSGSRRPKERRDGPPRLLLVLHDAEGGVHETTRDLLSEVREEIEAFLLVARPTRMTLCRHGPAGRDPLATWWLDRPWSHRLERSGEHRAIYREVLDRLGVDLVHVRHLLAHTDDLLDLASAGDVPVILSFHDYYMVCPTVHLLDDLGRYCGGRCTPSRGQCRLPFDWLRGLPVLKEGYLDAWRARVRNHLPGIDAFVTTSRAAYDVLVGVYPELAGRDFRVIEHGRSFPEQLQLADSPSPGEPVRIALPGHLGYHKGSDFIRRLVALDRKRDSRLELHFLGTTDPLLDGLGVHHGPYRRGELPARIDAVRPAFVGLFSVWAETYCHTLTEAWAMGIPVLASDLGALAERITSHGGGWTLPIDDVDEAYRRILCLADDPSGYRLGAESATLEGIRTVAEMADDYLVLYRDVLARRRRRPRRGEGATGR